MLVSGEVKGNTINEVMRYQFNLYLVLVFCKLYVVIQRLIQDFNLGVEDNDRVQGQKDGPNCLISAPTIAGSEEDPLKCSISELILPEKTKPSFFF